MSTKTPANPSLAEQLAPIAPRIRETRARIRAVSQVSITLPLEPGKDRFGATIDAILRWADNRAGHRMPAEARQRKTFELNEIGSQRLAAVAIEDPRVWALRLDDADKNVPLRTWITEVGVGVAPKGDVLFGVRLICATRGEDVPYERTIPGFVRGIVSSGPATLDGRPIGVGPAFVDDERSADDLVNFLEWPGRRAPAFVFALPERSVDRAETALPTKDFETRTLGVAHLFVLTGPASFHLTDRLGKEMSVFRQAIRTYLPGFNRWRDQPYRHPLALPERIRDWSEGGPQGYLDHLVSQALAYSVQVADREEILPSFMAIRQMSAKAERESARNAHRDDAELLTMALAETHRLESELKELKERSAGLIDDSERRADEFAQVAQETKAQNYSLRQRVAALEKRLAAGTGMPRIPEVPTNLNDFSTWCHENLSGAVELHNRAYQGIKKSVFREPALIYKALLLLRDQYVPMRLSGKPEDKAAYESALRELRLEDSATGTGWKEHREQYEVSYNGRPRLLERHLKQGTTRDLARQFRLYFFWDEDSQVVVVGWLPSHLDNALT